MSIFCPDKVELISEIPVLFVKPRFILANEGTLAPSSLNLTNLKSAANIRRFIENTKLYHIVYAKVKCVSSCFASSGAFTMHPLIHYAVSNYLLKLPLLSYI